VNAPELNVTLPAHNEATQLAASVRRVVACLAAQPVTGESPRKGA
jgi:hypothetical protein